MKTVYLVCLTVVTLPSLVLCLTIAFIGLPGPSQSSDFDDGGTEASESDPTTYRDRVFRFGFGKFVLSAGYYPRLATSCFLFGMAFIVSLYFLLLMPVREWIAP